MQAITADTYMYLRDSDLFSFDDAISALINNFNNLCDLYFFQDDNTNNNFLLITTELFERSFQYEFSDEVYKISNNSMDKINLSERFLNYVFGAECVFLIIENILSAMNFVSIWELLVHNGQY